MTRAKARATGEQRPLLEWLQIAGEVLDVWQKRMPGNDLETAVEILRVLSRHGVTIEELLALAQSAGPILDLLTRVRR